MGVPVNPHPSDEDLEWLYPSCLLYGKECFRAFRSIANYRYKMVCRQIQLRGDENFSCWPKKKNKISSVHVCGRAFFI